MNKDDYIKALSFWTLAIQYLALVENISKEIVNQGNVWFLIEDSPISGEEYMERTKWSDHNLIMPLLFNLYHGLELLLKGFLLTNPAGNAKPHHGIQDLTCRFANLFPREADLQRCFSKYTDDQRLPPLIRDFLRDNDLSFKELYQALRYPADTAFGNVKRYFHLKYRGEEGLSFFSDLVADVVSIRKEACRLGRSLEEAMASKPDSIHQPANKSPKPSM